MARVERKIPGKKEYPGKHYIWTETTERRLTTLLASVMTTEQIAESLNKDFPQRVKLTKNSIVGKTFRMMELRVGKKENGQHINSSGDT